MTYNVSSGTLSLHTTTTTTTFSFTAAVSADVSAECEELIKRMLTVDPGRRITIPEIVAHRWMTMAGADPEFKKLMHQSMHPLSPEPLEPLNELVLKHMDRLEIDRKQTLKVCTILFFFVYYPLRRQLFQFAAVRRVQCHTGLTDHF